MSLNKLAGLLLFALLLLPQAAAAEDNYTLIIDNQQASALRQQETQPTGMTVGYGPSVCNGGDECRWTLALPGSSSDFPGGRSLLMYFLGDEGQLGVMLRVGGPMAGASCLETPIHTVCQGSIDTDNRILSLTVSSN